MSFLDTQPSVTFNPSVLAHASNVKRNLGNSCVHAITRSILISNGSSEEPGCGRSREIGWKKRRQSSRCSSYRRGTFGKCTDSGKRTRQETKSQASYRDRPQGRSGPMGKKAVTHGASVGRRGAGERPSEGFAAGVAQKASRFSNTTRPLLAPGNQPEIKETFKTLQVNKEASRPRRANYFRRCVNRPGRDLSF